MPDRLIRFCRTAAYVVLCILAVFPNLNAIHAQAPPAPTFTSIPALAFDTGSPVIRAHTEALQPFTVAGERGVLVGQQDGTFEAWLLPVKLLSHMTIQADVEGYTVPIDVNQQSAEIEVRPDRTILTYAHIGFTVRQIMFSPADGETATSPVVLFEFDCLHPTDFTFRFTPELRWMWPERNEGVPSAEWVAPGPNAYERAGGFYVLHSDYPDFAGAVTIPGARPGILAPYQERPQVYPVELKLHIDPVRDRTRLFPLLMAVGTDVKSANSASLGAVLERENANLAASYKSHAEKYHSLLANSVSIATPDPALNDAFQWAVVSIEQLKTHVPSRRSDPDAGPSQTALVAGYYESGDSARPGFGWFFGRDALYTLFAVNGYGDFALTRSELEFLIARQRDDGKIMHEFSQTAGDIDWKSFPYMYAAADATPLFLLAMEDYVKASGDTTFLTSHRDAIEKAWAFETSHSPGADKGGNGIYTNADGTGWVESWPGGMPHQEVYLALLDQQASAAMALLEEQLKDSSQAQAASDRAATIAKTINAQFYDADKGCYAFSRNPDGSLDKTSTVYPALAWWSDLKGTGAASGGNSILDHPQGCLRQFAAATLNTDWGLRDVANTEKIYDGMSYHQGSVWPLFTGWGALAEYRGGQPLAGYRMLMENANLTHAQDLGAVTELLSGDFFVPFGRSTSHQLWSSAMVITPILRGLFGINVDATTKTIIVNPHLPATWDHAEVRHVRVGAETVDLTFTQRAGELVVEAHTASGKNVQLATSLAGAKTLADGKLVILQDAVTVGPMAQQPLPGQRTEAPRILSEKHDTHRTDLTLEGRAGTDCTVPLMLASEKIKPQVEGAEMAPDAQSITVHFPPGDGWKTITVSLRW